MHTSASTPDIPAHPWCRRDAWWIAALLLLTIVPYWQVRDFEFVALDDRQYVTESPLVQSGLEPFALWDALVGFHSDNWHPLVWWSLMADWQLFGNRPGAFHLENVLWHSLNVVLLFVALTELTGDRYRSAAVAAIFAIHPLHVESVAWVTERKDVLSGFFWMAGLWSYARWSRSRQSPGWWLLVTGCLVLGLMSKQIVVTLPCVFMLLDVWPLGRAVDRRIGQITISSLWSRFWEKGFWLGLCVLASVLAVQAQQSARLAERQWPLGLRLLNAVVSIARYLGKSIYPIGLSIQYPYDVPTGLTVALATLLILTISCACLWCFHRQPAALVGWLWFLGTLVPVIGLVQVGNQSIADRYMYLPLIGLSIAVVWTIPTPPSLRTKWALATATAACLMILTFCTASQTSVWRNTETLYDHALAIDPTNTSALYTVGFRDLESGHIASGLQVLDRAIGLDRQRTEARHRYAGQGDHKERKEQSRRWSEIYLMLGQAAAGAGESARAIQLFREATSVDPANHDARMSLGMTLADTGDIESAIIEFEEILRRSPGHENAFAAKAALQDRKRSADQ